MRELLNRIPEHEREMFELLSDDDQRSVIDSATMGAGMSTDGAVSNECKMSHLSFEIKSRLKKSYFNGMTMEADFESIEQMIDKWAEDRGLHATSNPKSQLLKAMAEMGELADAVNKGDFEEIIDGIGDVTVCLKNLAWFYGLTVTGCTQSAYNQIANRTGKTVGGVFIKDEKTP